MEERHQWSRDRQAPVERRGEQVLGLGPKQQFVRERDAQGAEIEAVGALRHAGIRQVGMIDEQVALTHALRRRTAHADPPRAAHLQPDAQAAPRDTRDVGRCAAHAVGGRAQLRHGGRADRHRGEPALELVAPRAVEFDGHAEQMPPTHLAPVVEAVLGSDVVCGEVQHGRRRLGRDIARLITSSYIRVEQYGPRPRGFPGVVIGQTAFERGSAGADPRASDSLHRNVIHSTSGPI